MKKIAILGSTGSIGTQTLDIVREQGDIQVVAMAAGSNISLLEAQMREFRPSLVSVWDEKKAKELRTNTKDLGIKIVSGMEGLLEVSVIPESEILVTAIVGMLGIRPTIAAIKAGKKIALANKETLVTAGHIIIPLAKEYKVPILPVDSEHSAIFQSLQGAGDNKISRILLTASGGPFRGRKADELKNIQVEDALKHPNWSMGRKITIDSSTLVNKGLEVMEAKWLFDVALDQIQVVVHPQSVIHSAVEYQDGAVIAQLGTPDMRLPIQYALYYPERRNLSGRRLDLFEIADLTFEKPDTDTFRGLALAYQAMEKGGNIPTVYNAANEKAVSLFLDRKISYPEITELIEACMENAEFIRHAQKEDTGMIAGMMGMHAQFTISDETMELAAANKPDGVGYHIHVAEGIEDLHHCLKHYGKRIVDRLMDWGILGEKTLLGHCIYINGHEMDLIKETNTMVVHNPESNMGNACGCPPTMELVHRGILTGLGTDGYTHDMTESYKVANVLHKHHLCDPNAAWGEVPQMLFDGNVKIAERYFPQKLGVLKEGAAADVIVVDYDPLTPMNGDNANSHILFGMTGKQVVTTVANGKVLMKDRELVSIDEAKVMADCRQAAKELAERINA